MDFRRLSPSGTSVRAPMADGTYGTCCGLRALPVMVVQVARAQLRPFGFRGVVKFCIRTANVTKRAQKRNCKWHAKIFIANVHDVNFFQVLYMSFFKAMSRRFHFRLSV